MNMYETKLDRCEAWLKGLLQRNGEVRVAFVVNAGINAGFSRALIFRARKQLEDHIYSTDGYKSRNNRWRWVE